MSSSSKSDFIEDNLSSDNGDYVPSDDADAPDSASLLARTKSRSGKNSSNVGDEKHPRNTRTRRKKKKLVKHREEDKSSSSDCDSILGPDHAPSPLRSGRSMRLRTPVNLYYCKDSYNDLSR